MIFFFENQPLSKVFWHQISDAVLLFIRWAPQDSHINREILHSCIFKPTQLLKMLMPGIMRSDGHFFSHATWMHVANFVRVALYIYPRYWRSWENAYTIVLKMFISGVLLVFFALLSTDGKVSFSFYEKGAIEHISCVLALEHDESRFLFCDWLFTSAKGQQGQDQKWPV